MADKKLSCSANTGRILLLIFNLLVILMGLASISGGIYLKVKGNDLLNHVKIPSFDSRGQHLFAIHGMGNVGVILIILGVIATLVSFFGCFGAFKQNRCMLHIYASLLIVIFLLQIIAIIFFFVARHKLDAISRKGTIRSLSGFYVPMDAKGVSPTSREYRRSRLFDMAQMKMNCCGATGPKDFVERKFHAWANKVGQEVPLACCFFKDEKTKEEYLKKLKPHEVWSKALLKQQLANVTQCLKGPQRGDFSAVHTDGCVQKGGILQQFAGNRKIVIIIGVILNVILLFGIITSFCLASSIGDASAPIS